MAMEPTTEREEHRVFSTEISGVITLRTMNCFVPSWQQRLTMELWLFWNSLGKLVRLSLNSERSACRHAWPYEVFSFVCLFVVMREGEKNLHLFVWKRRKQEQEMEGAKNRQAATQSRWRSQQPWTRRRHAEEFTSEELREQQESRSAHLHTNCIDGHLQSDNEQMAGKGKDGFAQRNGERKLTPPKKSWMC